MKVLFVGEGKTDIGPPQFGFHPRPARGPIPKLAKKICSSIGDESLAVAWTELVRFNPDASKRGFDAKVAAAIALGAGLWGCDATVCVADCDRKYDENRLGNMEKGKVRAIQNLEKSHAAVCALAVHSVEAWSLGVPEAIAAVLNKDIGEIRKQYPAKHVEDLIEGSGKEEYQPKRLLQKIAKLGHRKADVEFREEIAERTEIDALERACPQGFQPFAKAIREEICCHDPPPVSNK